MADEAAAEMAEVSVRLGVPPGSALPIETFEGMRADDLSPAAWLYLLESVNAEELEIPGDILEAIFLECSDAAIRFRLVRGALGQPRTHARYVAALRVHPEPVNIAMLPASWPKQRLDMLQLLAETPTVVRREILTPQYQATSIAYRADRRATHAPNNKGERRATLLFSSGLSAPTMRAVRITLKRAVRFLGRGVEFANTGLMERYSHDVSTGEAYARGVTESESSQGQALQSHHERLAEIAGITRDQAAVLTGQASVGGGWDFIVKAKADGSVMWRGQTIEQDAWNRVKEYDRQHGVTESWSQVADASRRYPALGRIADAPPDCRQTACRSRFVRCFESQYQLQPPWSRR